MITKEQLIDDIVIIIDDYQNGFEFCLFESFFDFTKGKYDKYFLNAIDASADYKGYGKCIVEVESYRKIETSPPVDGCDAISELFSEYLLVEFKINKHLEVKSIESINMFDFRKNQKIEFPEIIGDKVKEIANIIKLRGDFNEKSHKNYN